MLKKISEQIAYKRTELTSARIGLADLRYRLHEVETGLLRGVAYSELGKNEQERKLALDQLLRSDDEWKAHHLACHEAELRALELEGELESLGDIRRGEEWAIRAALADLPSHDAPPGSDRAVFDERATELRVVEAAHRFQPPARDLPDDAELAALVAQGWPDDRIPF